MPPLSPPDVRKAWIEALSPAKDSARGIAHRAGLGDASLRKIIAGTSYPDLRTIARLEDAAGTSLIAEWRERQPRLASPTPRVTDRNQPRLPLDLPDGIRADGTLRAIEICAGAGGQAI